MFAARNMAFASLNLTPLADPLELAPVVWFSDTGSDSSVWPDLSGGVSDAVQATVSARPAIIPAALAGRQVRRFDGGDRVVTPSITLRTVFVVTMPNAPNNLAGLIVCPNNTDSSLRRNDTAPMRYRGITGTASQDFSSGRGNKFFVNGQNTQDFVDGQWHIVSAESAAAKVGALGVGGAFLSRFWKGDIAEVVGFSGTLSSANRIRLTRWLGAKWGIAVP
jgi:hypothetical protein